MISIVIVVDSAVDIVSSSSSYTAVIATPELLLERCAQLC
jgi:hypothetical protein